MIMGAELDSDRWRSAISSLVALPTAQQPHEDDRTCHRGDVERSKTHSNVNAAVLPPANGAKKNAKTAFNDTCSSRSCADTG